MLSAGITEDGEVKHQNRASNEELLGRERKAEGAWVSSSFAAVLAGTHSAASSVVGDGYIGLGLGWAGCTDTAIPGGPG